MGVVVDDIRTCAGAVALKAAADAADVVIVFTGTELGYQENMESESRDRESMNLPKELEAAMHTILGWNHKRLVVVSRSGTPVGYTWVDKAKTLVQTSYLGMEEGNAIVDVLTGKVYVLADGTVTTGTMPNNGTVSKTLDATTITYTIPKGYHSGTGTVTITLETKTVTPTKSAQDITPTSGKVLSKVTVNPIPDNYIDTTDADATAANILVDKTAYVGGVKVTGTMANNGDTSGTIDGLTTTSANIPAGYTSGGTVSLTDDIETALAAI